jgi:hypothetical protein
VEIGCPAKAVHIDEARYAMSQAQNNRERFAGPHMIQDMDHMAHIPPVEQTREQGARQSDQKSSENRQSGAGKRQKFEYQNPRQVY